MTAGPTDESLTLFLADFESMSVEEGLACIDRFESLPGGADRPINPTEAEAIYRLCAELEAALLAKG